MSEQVEQTYYVTTPIYYVNDRPHIGHVYTTTLADILARYHRLRGDETFFLTGTDEHAAKVVDAARERGLSTQAWADQNATAFRQTFERLGISHDDFIRTSEERHTKRVLEYVGQLLESGDVYLGEYEGWYDAGQEEYIPESKAKELDYKSPFNKKPLIRKTEENFFFRLSAYAEPLLELLESGKFGVQPEGRKNEVISRIKQGLNDVPISRTGLGDWGIKVPGHEEHRIYVWIDALFNYLTTVDTEDRRRFWPAQVHLIGKDILWFHAVIWPAMLMALGKLPGRQWVTLPQCVHAHSFWIREGEKMSKSMGNFVDLEEIDRYVEQFGLDALRWFLVTHGPQGATDADFARAKFVEVYNADLANTVGNSFSRISNMIGKYLGGEIPAERDRDQPNPLAAAAEQAVRDVEHAMAASSLDEAARAAADLVRTIDTYIEQTQPYKMVKQEGSQAKVAAVLYNCIEATRIASLLLWPHLPHRMETLWRRIGCGDFASAIRSGRAQLAQWSQWGYLKPGTEIEKGEALFPRIQDTAAELKHA